MSEATKPTVTKIELTHKEIDQMTQSLIQFLNIKKGLGEKTKYRLANVKKQIIKISEAHAKYVREEIIPKYVEYDEKGEIVLNPPNQIGEQTYKFKSQEDEKECNKEMNKLKEEVSTIKFVKIPFSVFENKELNEQVSSNMMGDLEPFIESPKDF